MSFSPSVCCAAGSSAGRASGRAPGGKQGHGEKVNRADDDPPPPPPPLLCRNEQTDERRGKINTQQQKQRNTLAASCLTCSEHDDLLVVAFFYHLFRRVGSFNRAIVSLPLPSADRHLGATDECLAAETTQSSFSFSLFSFLSSRLALAFSRHPWLLLLRAAMNFSRLTCVRN